VVRSSVGNLAALGRLCRRESEGRGQGDLCSNTDPLGLLKYLQIGTAILDPQHLALELRVPDLHEGYRIFCDRRFGLDAHDVAGHRDDTGIRSGARHIDPWPP